MSFVSLFPRALAACLLLGLSAAPALAQEAADLTRPRAVTTVPAPTSVGRDERGAARLENDLTVVRESDEPALVREAAPSVVRLAPSGKALSKTPLDAAAASGEQLFRSMLTAAIEQRLGTPYRLGATGPYRYDCSGFVWSVFQAAGVEFERGSARTLWTTFVPAREDEKYKFGTLVFFNGLGHVGIVADAGGFYHASTSRGVVYSPFNDYWNERIVGFRRIPLPAADFVAAR